MDVRHLVVAPEVGEPGGSGGLDDAFLRLHDPGSGAEIVGVDVRG